jgi:hypothetical protein
MQWLFKSAIYSNIYSVTDIENNIDISGPEINESEEDEFSQFIYFKHDNIYFKTRYIYTYIFFLLSFMRFISS